MGLSALVAGGPGAAGDLEQHRGLSVWVQIGTSPDVQMVGPAVFAIADVGVVDVVAIDPQHAHGARRLGGATAGRAAPQARRVGAPIGAQAAVQRGGQRGSGLVACATEVHQAHSGEAGDQPRGGPHRTGEAAGGKCQPAELACECL